MNKHYGFWLLLEENDESLVSNIVRDLASKYNDGRVFIPHLSIFPSLQIDLKKLKLMLTESLSNTQSFEVEVIGIGMEDRWSKTLFLDIKLSEDLVDLNSRLESLFGEFEHEDNNYHPHISLIYNNELTDSEKRKISEYLQYPNKLKIRSLGIVDPGVDGNDWKDFTKWHVPFEIKFN